MSFVWNNDKIVFNNCHHFPSSLRQLICGSSGSGKTQLLFKLLLEQCPTCNNDYLDYDNLYLFTPSLHQTEYQILIQGFKNYLSKKRIIEFYKQQTGVTDYVKALAEIGSDIPRESRSNIIINAFDDESKIPLPESLDKMKKNLIVFDDCAYDKNSQVHLYFIRGRHNNCNAIYLSQNYFQLPKRSIRDNSNLFIFFKLDKTNITNIWMALASIDIPDYNQFQKMCSIAWKVKHDFISINRDEANLEKKYLINLTNSFISINMPQAGNGLDSNKIDPLDYYNQQAKYAKSENNLIELVKNNKNMKYTLGETRKEIYAPITKKLDDVKSTLKNTPIIETDTPEKLTDFQAVFSDLMNTDYNRDKTFGLIATDALYEGQPLEGRAYVYRFGALFDFANKELRETDHYIQFNFDTNELICKSNHETKAVNISKDLLILLTKDKSDVSQPAINEYKALLKFCFITEFGLLKDIHHKTAKRIELLKIFRTRCPNKWGDIIGPFFNFKGSGYEGMALTVPIIIKPKSSDQIERYKILLSSAAAGNNNPDILAEGSAILDELLKNKEITKLDYKLMYYKLKNLLE